MLSYTDWITRKILHVKDIKGPSGFIVQDIILCNKLGNSPSRIMQAVCRLLQFLDAVRLEPRTIKDSFALSRPHHCRCVWSFVVYNSWRWWLIIITGTAIIIILAVFALLLFFFAFSFACLLGEVGFVWPIGWPNLWCRCVGSFIFKTTHHLVYECWPAVLYILAFGANLLGLWGNLFVSL